MPIALYVLFAAAFAIGTSEFVIAGILPTVATDLSITIPTAGLLVSLYALGVAIGGPLLATFTGRFPRKRLMVVYIGIFTLGYAFCAVAPNFSALLGGRVAISLIHGAYFGTAMVVAINIVDAGRRGAAVALILAGLTVANVVGVPLGTAIGNAFGWRMTFWAISALGLISLILVALLVPADSAHEARRANLLAELQALTRPPVWTSLAIIVTQTIGQFALFTYISPLLTDVSGVSRDVVPWLLLLFGLGSTIGVLLGGRLADWKLMPSLVAILVVQVAIYLCMSLFSSFAWPMAVLVLAWGGTAFAFGSPVQTRILGNTRDAPTLAANLIPSAFNIAIAAGAWIGGLLLEGGAPYSILPWVGLIAGAVAAVIAIVAWRTERTAAA